MRRRSLPFLLAAVWLAAAPAAVPAQTAVVAPFEIDAPHTARNRIDTLVMSVLREKKIKTADLCSDAIFIRRVYLDMIGTLPEVEEVRRFLDDRRPDKRAALIEALFARDEFATYWSLKWCDVLRVKAEFPINLWPNGVQTYHRWIRDAVRDNLPYDRFARELLTSSGSNFRNPPVNFFRAVQGHEPSAIAAAAALTFMGTRVAAWPKDRREGLEAFFSRIAFKGTAEWKEEIVCLDPAPTEPLTAGYPDGKTVQIPAGTDPRMVFADWLITRKNPWFKRNIVNRVWSWLLGRGIIHEPDDIRDDNPPVNPRLLEFLESELVRAKWDLRHVFRLILNSRTYQQSSIPRSEHQEAEALFACYPVRRLDAEVLIDALCQLCGSTEQYSSAIPEPFTFIPETNRTIELADGSITSKFLEMFGRPSRDTGLESERNNQPSEAQRLHMLNSSHVQQKIERSAKLRRLIQTSRGSRRRMVDSIYLAVLSRLPTAAEQAAVEQYFRGKGVNFRNATNDLVWALVNTKEFLYRH
jgi:hypothetical protein